MKQSWKTLNSSNIHALVMGATVDQEMQKEILRLAEIGAEVTGSQGVVNKIGAPVIGFGGHETSVLPYPASGLPSEVVDRIAASTEKEVEALLRKTGKAPFSIVIVEISKDGMLQLNTMDEVRGQLHYNAKYTLELAMAKGKITIATAEQLKQLNDFLEARKGEGVSEEIYDNIATWRTKTTMRALREWSREVTDSASVVFDETKAELTEIGYFTPVREAEEVAQA
jgi:hypothetical protein